MRFFKELLRSRGVTVGRLDSRFLGIDRDTLGEAMQNDPSYTNIIGPYTAAFNDYVREELKFEKDIPYEILSEIGLKDRDIEALIDTGVVRVDGVTAG